MAVVRRVEWKRKPVARPDRVNELSPEESECVRVALGVLRLRHGTLGSIAKRMGISKSAVLRVTTKRGKSSAGFALRVARLAGVPVDDVLQGAFPSPGCCPYCGGNLDV